MKTTVLTLRVLFTAVLFLLFLPDVYSQTIVEPVGNVYVKGGTASDSNYYADQQIRVRGATGNNARKLYLKFDLTAVTSPFVKATLNLTARQIVAIAGGLLNRADVFTVSDDSWNEQTVTWNTAPPRVQYLFTKEFLPKVSSAPDTVYTFDLTAYVRSEYAGDKIVSLCMVDTVNNGSDIRFWSNRNLLATGPQLILSNEGANLTAPVGGENWLVGSTHAITWTASGITDLKIEYTTNRGASWSTIIASTPASANTYNWVIPNTQSTQCKVRVSSVNNPDLNAVSTAEFTITNPAAAITLTSPVGSETWKVGSAKNITWASANVANIKIELTTNNGIYWRTINSSVPASQGSYTWTVPFYPSSACKIRLSDVVYSTLNSVSAGNFTIADLPHSTILCSDNVYVKAGTAADSNYFSDTTNILRIRGTATDTSNWRKSYIKFNISSYSGNIAKVLLQITVNRVVAITGGLINRGDIFGASDDAWSEQTITWNNAPPRTSYLLSSDFKVKNTTEADTNYYFDITQFVKNEFLGNKVVTVVLADTLNNGSDVRFWSSRGTANSGPALLVYPDTATAVFEPGAMLPGGFRVAGNYPNPFNPATTLEYFLPAAGDVRVSMYNTLGMLVEEVFSGMQPSGSHRVEWNAARYSSGIYYCIVRYGAQQKTVKMALLK